MGILTVSCDECGVVLAYDYNKTYQDLAWFFCEKCSIKYELDRAKEELEEWVENPCAAYTKELKNEVLQLTKKLNSYENRCHNSSSNRKHKIAKKDSITLE